MQLDFYRSALAPRRAMRARSVRGLLGANGGGGIPDFNSLIAQEPSAASAWGEVQAQLSQEGPAGAGIIPVAQQHFYSSWTQLADTVQVLGSSDLTNISNAAASLALQNNSIAGAGNLIDGLVAGAVSGNPVEVVQAFSGTLCSVAGLAVGAGSISFGAGAAIVVGIALVTAWVDSLFSTAPPVATICGWNLNYQPNIVVQCAWTAGQPIATPGYGQLSATPQTNPFWRRFPEPSNANDSWWFSNQPELGGNGLMTSILYEGTWTSGKSSDTWAAGGQPTQINGVFSRPIDFAFPQYHQLECDVAVAGPIAALPDGGGSFSIGPITVTASPDDVMFARFIMAYFGAWKANAEYLLNGLQPKYAGDWDVLRQVQSFWNSTHQPGSGAYNLLPRNNNVQSYQADVITYPNPCSGTLQTEWWYVTMLINKMGVNSLQINTGPKITFPTVTPLVPIKVGHIPLPIHLPAPPPKSSSGTSTGLIVAGALGLAAAATAGGIYYYGRRHDLSFGDASRDIWDRIRHPGGGGRRRG